MDEFILVSAALKLGYAIFAFLALIYLSRWLDMRAGVEFRSVIQEIRKGNMAVAVYYGLRFIAVAFVVGNAVF